MRGLFVLFGHPWVISWALACYKFPPGTPDPCEDRQCHFGAECRPTIENGDADCVCPERCPTYGDSRGSRPICGSDGRDYPNVCELRKAACREMQDIQVKFQGRCDPCESVMCPSSQVCQLDDNRNPICRCNAVCSTELKPVCGSDGKTYPNECSLRMEACKFRHSLRIIYSGDCNTAFRLLAQGSNPCNNLNCGPSQECDIDRYGLATCQCPPPCEPVMRPVCASNGQTYDNECELKRQSCLLKQELSVKFRGVCGEEGPCIEHICELGAVCVVTRGKAVCECPTCSEEFHPVCGTDSMSYTNECKLRREACLHNKAIHVVSEGLCSGCGTKLCDYYATCEHNAHDDTTQCICPLSCEKKEDPICGSDGLTYLNECEMRITSCKRQQHIAIAAKGPCDVCHNVHCKYGARCEKGRCVCPTDCPDTYEPLCANDGSTYSNECEMRKAACRSSSKNELVALFYGECEDVSNLGTTGGITCQKKICRYGAVCEYDSASKAQCMCDLECLPLKDPVCGSDGRLYSNECQLREESCKQQRLIRVISIDRCDVPKVTPCDGDRPLQDPTTGLEYFCGAGLSSQICPADSYCHKSSEFAKCCREDGVSSNHCSKSQYGCCPDERTAASGYGHLGCPSDCECNRLGSRDEGCDSITKQCHCKNGVGGNKCERCEPGYWGLHKIADGHHEGCIPCACNKYGSVRDDCEQMTGRCVCKHGIQGLKCDVCPQKTVLGPLGCTDESIAYPVLGTCSQLKCRFGAVCVEHDGQSQCKCTFRCSHDQKNPICASDGHTYLSECDLQEAACYRQQSITIRTYGSCKKGSKLKTTQTVADGVEPTVGPLRRSTVQKSTSDQFESRSTRDIPFGLSEGLLLSTGPTTARPPEEGFPVEVPGFSGQSFLELERLHAYTRLSLELEFRSFATEGILLYNGQTASGMGDFVSLAIRNGFVEFRYNLGSGPIVLRSPQPLQPGRFHRLVAKRYLRDGMLTLDGQQDVAGRSEGILKSLDLVENLYVGYVPSDNPGVFDNIGLRRGFVGCIRRLRIGHKEIVLNYPQSKDIIRGDRIRECSESPCSSLPCQNGATCIESGESYQCTCKPGYTGQQCEEVKNACSSSPCPKGSTCASLDGGTFSCHCPPDRKGKLCEHPYRELQETFVSDFNGQSYLQLPTLQNVGQTFTIELWFLSRSPNGLLLYDSQAASGHGDFLSITLLDRFVQFRYDLGSGSANQSGLVVITSPSPVTLDVWHAVKVTRLRRKGTLQVDEDLVVTGESQAPLSELNLDQPLFLGGYKSNSALNPQSGVLSGLNGALQRMVVNGEVWDNLRFRAVEISEVNRYTGPPCGDKPCVNGGICVAELNDYHCRCPLKYSGLKCEKQVHPAAKDYAIALDGQAHLSFPIHTREKPDAQSYNRFDIRFRTTNPNGLLLWTNKGYTIKGDYLAIALNEGYVELTFNLGKQQELLIIRHPDRVDDGLWHVATINRNKRLGTLQIDSSTQVGGTSEPGATELNTDGILWIGGSTSLPVGLPTSYYQGYKGCLHSVLVDGEPLFLALQAPANVGPCTS